MSGEDSQQVAKALDGLNDSVKTHLQQSATIIQTVHDIDTALKTHVQFCRDQCAKTDALAKEVWGEAGRKGIVRKQDDVHRVVRQITWICGVLTVASIGFVFKLIHGAITGTP